MPYKPPEYKPGDPIRAADFNAENAEIARLGRLRGGAGLVVRSGARSIQATAVSSEERIFLRITGVYSAGYPWEEVLHQSPNTWITSGYTGTAADDPAFERQSGDTTLTADGTVYEARRSPSSDVWTFDGKN